METLPPFLKHRAEHSFRYLLRETEGISTEDALQFARAEWQPHRFGVGQNGSIAGIIYHVAAWKQMTLPLLSPDGIAQDIEYFDKTAAPDANDWNGICAWLRQIGETWNAEIARLPDADFDHTRQWGSATITLAECVVEMLEHDIQHAAQVEYLKQRLLSEKSERD